MNRLCRSRCNVIHLTDSDYQLVGTSEHGSVLTYKICRASSALEFAYMGIAISCLRLIKCGQKHRPCLLLVLTNCEIIFNNNNQ